MCPDILLTEANTFMFDWNLLITVAAGLGGVMVGGYYAKKTQDERLKHTDENRFQEERMDTYVDFLSAAHTLHSIKKVRLDLNETDISINKELNMRASDNTSEIVDALQRLHLIASTEVRDIAKEVFDCAMDGLHKNKDVPLDENKYEEIRNKFRDSARKELKIDKKIK